MNKDGKILIGFDLDGVIIDHSKVKILLAKKLGFKVSKKQIPADIMIKLLPDSVYQILKYGLYDDPKTALKAELMSGFKRFLNVLIKKNIPFLAISRRKRNFEIPVQLLKKYNLWGSDLFHSRNVYFVSGPNDKNNLGIKLGVTHFIDDEPQVLEGLTAIKNKYLFDPYKSFKKSPYVKVTSWKELASKIKF